MNWARARCGPRKHNAIFWVDILSHFLYRYSLADSSVQRWSAAREDWMGGRAAQ